MNREDVTSDILNELLRYEPDTGELYWKERGEKWFEEGDRFSAESKARIWNTRFAGKEAFTYKGKKGYKRSSIFNFYFEAHRIIWCMMTGGWPDQVDHINGVRDDNRWCNLREVDQKTNGRNSAKSTLNTSGVRGVSWCNLRKKWRVRIYNDESKRIELGYYRCLKAATEIRKEAEKEYGYHENHGRDVG